MSAPTVDRAALTGADRPDADMPGDGHYARNLIGGQWRFPAAPYEYEVRNPTDSSITTVVPLSSRFDVASAVQAAAAAAPGWAADPARRAAVLLLLADELDRLARELSELQVVESGLPRVTGYQAIMAAAQLARSLAAGPSGSSAGGVTAHVLSWGLPMWEIAASVLAQLAAGRTAVVKPSLRAPLSAVAFAHLATRAGLPPGVLNVVQGTGEDVGAALLGRLDLARLQVRAGERTLAQAARAVTVSAVPLHGLRAGGNIALVGRDADPAQVATAVADTVRVHSTGGPLGMPLLVVHARAATAVVDAVVSAARGVAAAPLPTESLRRRCLTRIETLRERGAVVLTGGHVPDDVRHRMGWLVPPTVASVGALGGARIDPTGRSGEPLGPVVTVATWRSPTTLAGAFAHPRFADGVASVWAVDDAELATAGLPHQAILRDRAPATAFDRAALPPGWTGGVADTHGPGGGHR